MSIQDEFRFLYAGTQYSEPPSVLSEYAYSQTASSLESSIAASAAPTSNYSAPTDTVYFGVSASATTPVGGGVVGFGVYSDSYGMVGGYWSAGAASGIPGLSLGIASGKTQRLAGESISASASLGVPRLPISPGISASASFDPSTGRVTGNELGVGVGIGPPIGAMAAYTSTTTTEFTSLYLGYIQFLNWVGYPGKYAF